MHTTLCGRFVPNSISAARCASLLEVKKYRTKVKPPTFVLF
ncbi:DUF6783 domain-containing protein [Blautia pseudococcoides]